MIFTTIQNYSALLLLLLLLFLVRVYYTNLTGRRFIYSARDTRENISLAVTLTFILFFFRIHRSLITRLHNLFVKQYSTRLHYLRFYSQLNYNTLQL